MALLEQEVAKLMRRNYAYRVSNFRIARSYTVLSPQSIDLRVVDHD
jgi:hypothetical protein